MKNHMRVVWQCFALLVVMLIVGPVFAAPTFKGTGLNDKPASLTLLKTQCSNATVLKHWLRQGKPEFLDKLKDARLLWDGKVWSSCWLLFNGVVYSIDEEGSKFQPIPLGAFRDDAV